MIKVNIVSWKPPLTTKYKLNTDGSALTNPGKIGGGGILRNEYGDIIYAFAIPLGKVPTIRQKFKQLHMD